MERVTRRNFLGTTLALGAGLSGFAFDSRNRLNAALRTDKDAISLAEWALVQEIRDGKWKNLDFPRVASEDFGIKGVEFVNTLFEVPTNTYLNQLKKNAEDLGVKMVLIMVDAEGRMAAPTKEERKQTVINHQKWIDIAHYLGCHAIRTNCHGPSDASTEDMLNWASDSYNNLLEYAMPARISVLIENHGGISNDADFLISLLNRVNNLYFGLLPDYRGPGTDFDHLGFLEKALPYAQGMSVRMQPTAEETEHMIKMCRDAGYRGYYGIETSGREGIRASKKVLDRVLFGK